ncbi:MAG: tetratricopeptide repeat protein [Gemmatimonadales bacterium]
MTGSRERAFALLAHKRYDQAEQELRLLLGREPQDPVAHALLGLCLLVRKRLDEAQREAEQAIGLAPELALGHQTRARVLLERNRFADAAAAVHEAITREPENPDHFAVLAAIEMEQERWRDALNAADQGLALDPEHAQCTNLRAMALQQLNQREQADAALRGALARDPENALTHANRGWTLLNRGKREEALEHFREALRLEPELDWARQGLVEALKARHTIYGALLRYFAWMSRLPRRTQWLVVIGGYVGYRVLRNAAAASPALQPLIAPLLVAYVSFALMTWIGPAVFDLVLRASPLGRLALARDQRLASTLVGLALGAAAVAAIAVAAGAGEDVLLASIAFVLLTIPISATFRCATGWPRTAMGAYAGVLAALALVSVTLSVLRQPAGLALGLFFVGAIAAPWVGNGLMAVKPRK